MIGFLFGFLNLAKTYPDLIGAAFLLMVFSGFGQSVFLGVFLPEIQHHFNIDNTAAGSIYAAGTLTSALLMIWSGKMLDIWPFRRFVILILAGLAAGCVTMAFASHPFFLFIAFLLLRQFGQGLMTLAGTTAVNRYIAEGRGRAQSLVQTGLPMHAALFPVVGVAVLHLTGFRMAWLSFAGFIIFILLPLFWVILRHHEGKTHTGWLAQEQASKAANPLAGLADEWTRRRVLKDWRFYAIISIMIIAPCFGTAVFFYQTKIAEALMISSAVFAGGFITLTIASIAAAFAAGAIIDKYGEKILLIAFPVFYGLGLYILTYGSNILVFHFALALLGIGGGIISVTGGPLFVKLYGSKNFASIKSLSFMAVIIASAISPPFTGLLLDQGIHITTILGAYALYTACNWIILLAFMNKLTTNKEQKV